MKYFVVVLACCLAGAFAAVTDVPPTKLSEEQMAKLREYKAACIAETGIDEAVVQQLRQGMDVPADEKVNCFSACMLKKIGIMKPDGTIDEDVARSKVPEGVPTEKVDETINTCKALVGMDSCETGGNIMRCLEKSNALSLL